MAGAEEETFGFDMGLGDDFLAAVEEAEREVVQQGEQAVEAPRPDIRDVFAAPPSSAPAAAPPRTAAAAATAPPPQPEPAPKVAAPPPAAASPPPAKSTAVTHAGWLVTKKGSKATLSRKGMMKERWYMLQADKILWRDKKEDGTPLGVIRLADVTEVRPDKPDKPTCTFVVVTPSKKYRFMSRTEGDCKNWVAAIDKAL